MPAKGKRTTVLDEATDPESLAVWTRRHLEHLRVRGYSESGLRGREHSLVAFVEWAQVRGLHRPQEISRPVLETYARYLFYRRKPNGEPLTFSTQRKRLQPLKVLFKWLTRERVVLANPASELDLPRVGRRLPSSVLTVTEAEKVLAMPDVAEPLGLRDRAMMELLYSTGMRRHEMLGLEIYDLDHERKVVFIRAGKGDKDRVVPVGDRALGWVRRYLDQARPLLLVPPDDGTVFLSVGGDPLGSSAATQRLRRYVIESGVPKKGAVHLWRHTCATLMLEAGADVRAIQELLGHAEATTTAIYTRVSIKHLQKVHAMTHPTASTHAQDGTPGRKGEDVRDEVLEDLVVRLAVERDADDA